MVVLFANREVVIYYHLLQHALMKNPSHVDAVFVDLEIREDGFDAIFLLREASDCTQEVAVSYPALKNVICRNGCPHKLRPFH